MVRKLYLTEEMMKELYPKLSEEWHKALVNIEYYEITTLNRIAGFLSQCGHESSDFTRLRENLNYSENALRSTWPSRFDMISSKQYARKPQMIANKVYSNRMGNGNEQSGDGWKYIGRGAIQITGKNNYRKCSLYLFDDLRLLDNPDLLLEPKFAILSACYYWDVNNLNSFCDSADIHTLTRRINGGTHGLTDRKQRFDKIRLELLRLNKINSQIR